MTTPTRRKRPRVPQPETPLMTLHRVWRQLSNEDRARFLVEMLTPNERRLVASGVWEEERAEIERRLVASGMWEDEGCATQGVQQRSAPRPALELQPG